MKKSGRNDFREVNGLARFAQGPGEKHSYFFYHKAVPDDVGEHPLLFHQGEALLSRGDGSLFQYDLNLLSDLSLQIASINNHRQKKFVKSLVSKLEDVETLCKIGHLHLKGFDSKKNRWKTLNQPKWKNRLKKKKGRSKGPSFFIILD